MFCSIFVCNIIKINHFILTFKCFCNSILHTVPAPAPYGYEVILSKVCNLLSLLLLEAILLIYSINTLCFSLLNICCGFNTILPLCRHFLYSSNLSIRFITHFFVSLAFLSPLPSST